MLSGRYLALGDSLTQGWGDPEADGRLVGWAVRFARLHEVAGAPLALTNLATRNADTKVVLAEQLPEAERLHPELASVLVGVNDACADFRPRRFAGRFGEILDRLGAACNTVFTGTLPDFTLVLAAERGMLDMLHDRLEQASGVIREEAVQRGVPVLDLWRLPALCDPAGWAADRLHPGPAGHRSIAEAAHLLVDRHDQPRTPEITHRPTGES